MNTKAKILYAEDDVTLSFVTRDNLELYGYSIDYCEDGIEALRLFGLHHYDICIFDVMMPKMDGFQVAQKIREKNEEIPILFLTAKSTKEDRIHGLKIGADDYITKPFSIEELVLKIEVFLKRTGHKNKKLSGEFPLGKYIFDISNHTLQGPEKLRHLTYREAALLKLLCENQDIIIKRDDILMQVWGDDHYFASRSLDVFISRLRKYLHSDPEVKIENIHNVGYRLKTKI